MTDLNAIHHRYTRRLAIEILRLEAKPVSHYPDNASRTKFAVSLRANKLAQKKRELLARITDTDVIDLTREQVAAQVAGYLAEVERWRNSPQATGQAGGKSGVKGGTREGAGRPRNTCPVHNVRRSRCPVGCPERGQ